MRDAAPFNTTSCTLVNHLCAVFIKQSFFQNPTGSGQRDEANGHTRTSQKHCYQYSNMNNLVIPLPNIVSDTPLPTATKLT